MNYQLKIKNHNKIHWPFWASLSILFIFLSIYGFCAKGLVANAIDSRALRSAADKITPRVSELEIEYVALQNQITLEKAYALGFQDTASEFIAGAALGKSVSMKNEIQ